ncbi:MAG: hypothetical protein ACIAQZ_04750 [Sedimentisphaeraceae bacterium JB056]
MCSKIKDTKDWICKHVAITLFMVVAFVVLLIMGWLSYPKDTEFDFVIAWAALFGGIGGIGSLVTKNEALKQNDNARLSDSRQERLALIASDVLEKTYLVHRAITNITSPLSFKEEGIKTTDEKGEEVKIEKTDLSQAEIFAYRFQKHDKLFSNYFSLDIKAKVYFNNEVYQNIQDMKSVIIFIRCHITTLLRYTKKAIEQNLAENTKQMQQIEDEIEAFYSPGFVNELFEEKTSSSFQKNIETFNTVCKKLELELSGYIRGKEID